MNATAGLSFDAVVFAENVHRDTIATLRELGFVGTRGGQPNATAEMRILERYRKSNEYRQAKLQSDPQRMWVGRRHSAYQFNTSMDGSSNATTPEMGNNLCRAAPLTCALYAPHDSRVMSASWAHRLQWIALAQRVLKEGETRCLINHNAAAHGTVRPQCVTVKNQV